MMPKGHKTKNGYATVSNIDNALDYRRIAEVMSLDGDVMNHATARNVFLHAMKKIAKPVHMLYNMPVTDDIITQTAKDPRFQESIIEILGDLAHENKDKV